MVGIDRIAVNSTLVDRCLVAAEDDDRIRCVVLRAVGRSSMSGGDLDWIRSQAETDSERHAQAMETFVLGAHRFISRLRTVRRTVGVGARHRVHLPHA